jgi:hypothetical protein
LACVAHNQPPLNACCLLLLLAAAAVQVWQRVSPLLADKPDVLAWLKRNTAPLKQQLAAAESAAPAPAMAAV